MKTGEDSYYNFSCLVPKVKKSIKKYKKSYNSEFLSKFLQQEQDPEFSPPKFLQPITSYRFYGDLVLIDNPESFSGSINQVSLHMLYKSISKVDINKNFEIFLEDKFNDYSSLDLYLDRLNSLGNQEAHDITKILEFSKSYLQISKTSPLSITDHIHQDQFDDLIIKEDEIQSYKEMIANSQQYFVKNQCCFKVKLVFNKTEPFLQYGPVIKKLEFSPKVVYLFLNKEINDLTQDDAFDIINLPFLSNQEYFSYLKTSLGKHFSKEGLDFSDQSFVKTFENQYIPCTRSFTTFQFKGENYEEYDIFINYEIKQKYFDDLMLITNKKKEEELYKIKVEQAKKKAVYKRIIKMESESWRTLTLLYFGNNENESELKNESFDRESFWNNVDQSKVCKHRLINDNKN